MNAPAYLHASARPLVSLPLRAMRQLHLRLFAQDATERLVCDRDPDHVATRIVDLLGRGRGAMLARFGSVELAVLANYLAITEGRRSWRDYIAGKSSPWWWNARTIREANFSAGFFPPEVPAVERFCRLMLADIPELDLLGSWLPQERVVQSRMPDCAIVELELLNPYFSRQPWTHALAGRKVLVIHPFATTIEAQYRRRELIYPNGMLPAFSLRTIKAVQAAAGESTGFADWFAALDSMKQAMSIEDFDVALIGCGAFGFPLAAHAKRLGRVGFHLGGSLQLLFGIRGRRWENPAYNPLHDFSRLMNEHWVRPARDETPKLAGQVEDACYW